MAYPPNQPYPPQPYPPTYPPPPQGNGMAVTAMVLGILAIILCWVPFLNWLLALLAIIFGAIGISVANKRQSGKGMAIAGLVCGAIGAIIGILLVLLVFTAARAMEKTFDRAKVDMAQHDEQKLVYEGYPLWAQQHAEEQCPKSVDELADNTSVLGSTDPWGHSYKMFCGANLPPGAKGVAILSLGPDGVEGTDDDIKSW